MKYKCKIDNVETKIRDGFTIVEEMNETLDSGTIQFVSKNREKNIEPFDSVVFEEDTNFSRKKLLVDAYQSEIEKFNNTDIKQSDFSYLVNLFSETKILERITLPNLSITKRASGTQRTVFEVIKEYCKRYLPVVKVYDETLENRYKYCKCLRYDEELETKFNVECPEFIWNTPTLKEVLTDLMSVVDCIPVVKDNVLTFFDLKQKGNEIDTSKLSNLQTSATSADYCDSLTLPMKNVISKKAIIVNELLTPHSLSGEMTSNNAVYITKKPIYKVIRAYLYVYEKSGNDYKLSKVDITNHILEKESFDILYDNIYPDYFTMPKHKAFNLWFKRGDFTINHLADTYKRIYAGIGTHPVWAWMASFYLTSSSQYAGNYDTYSFDHPLLLLEYETYDENTVCVSKEKPIKNKQNALFDSQSTNAVDLEHQTIFEYAKVNRLASKIITIYGEYKDESDIPQLSDYIDNKILFHREITYYDGIMLFKGMLCDDYILKDYFTGVNAKERSWNIVDTNDAIRRDDVYKFYVEISADDIGDKELVDTNRNLPYRFQGRYFLHNMLADFTRYYEFIIQDLILSNGIYGACFSTYDKNNTRYPNSTASDFGITDVETFTGEKNISLFMKAKDNFAFGDQVLKEDDDGEYAYTMKPIPYTDGNGECVNATFCFDNWIDVLDRYGKSFLLDFNKLLNWNTFDSSDYLALLDYYKQVPLVKFSGTKAFNDTNAFYVDANFVKDNREIISSTFQFEYVSDNENIFINEGFAQIFGAGNSKLNIQNVSGDWANNIGIKYSNNHLYKKGDTEPVGFEATSFFINRINECSTRYHIADGSGSKFSWCIYSKITGKILLAVNLKRTIYLNFRYTRDINVYNNLIDKVIIGNMGDSASSLDYNYEENPQEVETIKVLNRTIDVSTTKEFD